MNKNFEKDNKENLQLAKDAHRLIADPEDGMEVRLIHTLYTRTPDGIEESNLLTATMQFPNKDAFRSVIHDLERRGIIRVDVLGEQNLYTLTREFAAIMRAL